MDRAWLQDFMALVVIAAVVVLTAFVTFGILKARGTSTDFSLEDSIVGALVATGMFSSIDPKSAGRAAPSWNCGG